ncbi:acetyl-CoA carboxylase carboxyltransferase subunit [Prauserella marina]|uniref:Acetyl-CoA carboxylase, carboxyltransferase component n=1 Tax=Prauserella marina TaxID=530584 RepID=A0A222VRB4_9PSEU|nr:carboxyl transferase domain-containing protein [Prauserella marina]ASR36271.1 acetyl-CoA carboxylase carboxyltransferase subunit [Prauserella marina]PWV77046.1 acetyl-CoA carboxylase carboxyltransferase component [Prauserella marina]SDD03123.1 Acetyl-CoA carboxylase, carboxyltransferase component [Prauserella marina]
MTGYREEWLPLLDELATRRAGARAMGGEAKLARVKARGGLPARARVEALLDEGSFVELGTLAGDGTIPADAFVAGSGTVDGRGVLVGAEDFTVAGGSIGTAAASKRARLATLARQERLPLVLMLEGAGHRATNALTPHRPAPGDLQALVELSGLVPTIAVVTGPSAGHGALTAPLADFTIMVEGQASLFTAGPPLVLASVGERVTKEELGGTTVHAEGSGLAHHVAATVLEALDTARRYLSYLPSSAWQRPPVNAGEDVEPRAVPALLDIVPPDARRPYDMRAVIKEVFDAGSVCEPHARYGTSLLTAFARLGGVPVAVVANQPAVLAGAIDVRAADKAARFVERTTAFHLPLVLLADNPGVLAGSASEKDGILRAGARMFAAQHRAHVPKLHVTLRKVFGFGSSVMGMNAYDNQTVSLAFPGATLGAIPAAVGGATAKADPGTRKALLEAESAGPWRLAGSVTYDEVIEPGELRTALLDGLRLAAARREGPFEPVSRTGYLP